MKRKNLGKIISVFLLIIWCCLIFYFSSQVGSVSENSSSHFLMFINSLINIFFKSIDLTKSRTVVFIVRKFAHMFLYFILYLLCYYVSHEYNIKNKTLFCFLFCFLYALSDEIHQLFVYDRSFGISDILIDLVGSSIGYWLLNILFIKIHRN